MNNLLTAGASRKQNPVFVGTSGVSEQNRSGGFKPAFYNLATGQAEPPSFAEDLPEPTHLLDELPDPGMVKRDDQGRVSALKDTAIAGCIRGVFFCNREQAAAAAVQIEQE